MTVRVWSQRRAATWRLWNLVVGKKEGSSRYRYRYRYLSARQKTRAGDWTRNRGGSETAQRRKNSGATYTGQDGPG